METTNLIIVRHGETEWNRAGKIQGDDDSPLTEEGREQARLVGKFLKGTKLDAIYTSDLGRTIDTTKLINENLALDYTTLETLRERRFGKLQGLDWEGVRQNFGDDVYGRFYNDPHFCDHGTETQIALQERIVSAVEGIAKNHVGQTVLVITHGGCLNALFRHILQIPYETPRRFSLRNCTLNRVQYDKGNWIIDMLGADPSGIASSDEATA